MTFYKTRFYIRKYSYKDIAQVFILELLFTILQAHDKLLVGRTFYHNNFFAQADLQNGPCFAHKALQPEVWI